MSSTIQSDTLFVGHPTLHFDSLASTNDHLKQIAATGEAIEGLTVLTEYQTSGRGQIGNSWQSEFGKNLLLSVFLTPKSLSAAHFFSLNMSVCLAVADCLNYLTPGFRIKWPNDILFDGKKVAGILIESSIAKGFVQSCVAGIGINVNQWDFEKTSGSFQPASLKRILGMEQDKEYLLKLLYKQLESRYLQLSTNRGALLKDYHHLLFGLEEPLKVKYRGRVLTIKIREVLADGQLVAISDKSQHHFLFKDIEFLP